MTQPDPRQQIRDLIAATIINKLNEWGVGEPFPEDQLADAVMGLFPEVTLAREYRSRSLILPVAPHISGQVRATHSLFVLRTAPEPIRAEEPPDA